LKAVPCGCRYLPVPAGPSASSSSELQRAPAPSRDARTRPGGQAAVARSAGVHNPVNAGAVAEGRSRGGQAAVARSAGVHAPAHAGAVAEGRSRGGQAAAAVRAQQSEVVQLLAEQEARGGPVVGSRKRTAVQRTNL
jgi:hypothetical protein